MAVNNRDTQILNTPARRVPGPHASQPRVGVMMQLTVASAESTYAVFNSFVPGGSVSVPAILDIAIDDVAKGEGVELVDLLVESLSGVLSAELRREAALREAALCRSLGLSGRRTSTVAEYFARVIDCNDEKTRVLADAVVALWCAADEAKDLIRPVILDAVAAIENVSTNESLEDLVARGFDGERVCWSVISFEGRKHVPLVLKEANRAAKSWSDRGADSLIGYAWQGLRLALRNYDPTRGMFSTYACPRIRGTIRDGIRSEHHLPKRLTTFVHKVDRARDDLSQRLGRHPSLEEIAEAMELDVDKLGSITRLGTPLSLNELEARGDSSFESEDEQDPEEAALARARWGAVIGAMANMNEEDAEAVRLLVLDGVSMVEAQSRTGVSARQLRQRRDRGLETLRAELVDWSPTV